MRAKQWNPRRSPSFPRSIGPEERLVLRRRRTTGPAEEASSPRREALDRVNADDESRERRVEARADLGPGVRVVHLSCRALCGQGESTRVSEILASLCRQLDRRPNEGCRATDPLARAGAEPTSGRGEPGRDSADGLRAALVRLTGDGPIRLHLDDLDQLASSERAPVVDSLHLLSRSLPLYLQVSAFGAGT